jgi:cell fate regulator YaaT (PSP1 superfamily)
MDNDKKYFYARVLADTNLYIVELGQNEFHYGQEVLINTEFGKDIAVISSFLFDEKPKKKTYESAVMLRYVTPEDKSALALNVERSQELKSIISDVIKRIELEMNITHILLPLYGNTIVVYYLAKGRVDFRQLLIELRSEFKERVVMRQISTKDRSNSFAVDCRIPLEKHYTAPTTVKMTR